MTDSSILRPAVGPSGFFTLAMGAMVGSGWVVVLGDWLRAAGPGGAVIGFLAGGATMICVSLCYGELAGRAGHAGGEFLFILNSLGRGPAFIVGWFLALFAAAVCAFESVVLGSLLHSLIPSIAGGSLYQVAGTAVDTASLVIGITGASLIALLHIGGAAGAIRFQNIVTYGFIVLMLIVVALGLALGSAENLSPAFHSMSGKPWSQGAIWVFALCAFFLNGWQTAIHAIEERRAEVSVRQAIRAIVLGIVCATLLYCGIVVAAASAAPWQQVAVHPMPAKEAFDLLLPGGSLGTIVIVAATVSVAKTWSAVAWLGSRLVVALARERLLPESLAALDARNGAPRNAILLITALSIGGPLCGRSALLPLVDMVSICLALSILLCVVVLIRQRRKTMEAPTFRVPGGYVTIVFALGLSLAMIGIAILSPVLEHPGHIPIEWLLLGGWSIIGGIYYWSFVGRRPVEQE